MKRHHILHDLVLCVAATAVSCAVAAALHTKAHPDDRRAIYRALTGHNLDSVTVDQDQAKGVIRLGGIVTNPGSRDLADQLAQHAAPGYTIENEIQVNRAGLL